VEGTGHFAPTAGSGCGTTTTVKDFSAEGCPALSWDAFWGPDSPYCRDGVVRGRFTLAMSDS